MNKSELAAKVSEKTGYTKKVSEEIVGAVLESIVETVASGESVSVIGFGTFEQHQRGARTGKNPATGEEIKIPARKVPVFKAGKGFREAVNAKKNGKKKN